MTILRRAVRAGLAAGLLGWAACGGAGEGETRFPVREPVGPVDAALAEAGERAFRERGCVTCHRVGGGRLVGPDLLGLPERRTFEWYYHMVTNPDSMLRDDTAARELLAEYMTPMLDQNATPEETRAIWEYLRHEGSERDEGTETDDTNREGRER